MAPTRGMLYCGISGESAGLSIGASLSSMNIQLYPVSSATATGYRLKYLYSSTNAYTVHDANQIILNKNVYNLATPVYFYSTSSTSSNLTETSYARVKAISGTVNSVASYGNLEICASGTRPTTSVAPSSSSYSLTGNIIAYGASIYLMVNGTSSTVTTNGQVKANSFYATSDRRLKENIEDFKYDKSVLDLAVKTFNFKADEKKTKQIGIIAQDLQEVYPELVKEDENGYLSVNDGKFAYLLLEELKKQNKKIEELENRINELERGV